MGGRLVSFREVNSTGKQNDSNKKKKDEEAKFPHAGPERVTQDLQTLGVPGELEDAKHPHQTDDPQDGKGHGLLTALLLRQVRAQGDEIRQDGHDVYDVHDVLEEVCFAWARKAAHCKLKGEPNDAHGLYNEERVIEDGVLPSIQAKRLVGKPLP